MLLRTHGRAAEYPTVPYAVEAMGGYTTAWRGREARVTALVERDASARTVRAGGHTGAYASRGTTALALAALHGAGGARRGPWSLTTALSGRRTGTGFGALDRDRTDARATLRAETAWSPADALTLHAGAEGALLRETARGTAPATARFAPDAPVLRLDESRDARHAGAWSEAEWQPRGDVTVRAGLRADRLPGEAAWTADPRLAVSYGAGAWTASASGGAFHQGRWRARDDRPDRDAPLGVARRARHLVAGVERAGDLTVRAEAYVKRYDAYVGDAPTAAERATVTGADLLVRPAALGPVRAWATYSWMRARAALRDGGTARTPLDVTHALAAVGHARLAPGWELGSTLRLATGRPITAIVHGEPAPGGVRPVYGAPYGTRLPGYARLDARLTRSARVGDGLVLGYAEALNVLGRANVATWAYDETFRAREAVPYFFGRRTIVLGLEARY